MPLWMADAVHAFADRRLAADIRYVEGSIATKALVAKDADVLMQGAVAMIGGDLNGGLDLAYVAAEINHSSSSLNVGSGIQTAADLKGKIVGTDQPGTITNYQTTVMLSQLGLQPSDVSLRAVGGSSVQISSLLSGQLQAATLSPPFSFQAVAKGFKPLTTGYQIPLLDVGAVVERTRIDALTPALVAFVEGCRQGIQAFNDQRDLALKVMQQYTKETDQNILQTTYDFYKTSVPYQENQQPLLQGIQGVLDFLGKTTVPAAKTAKAEQFVDSRVLSHMAQN